MSDTILDFMFGKYTKTLYELYIYKKEPEFSYNSIKIINIQMTTKNKGTIDANSPKALFSHLESHIHQKTSTFSKKEKDIVAEESKSQFESSNICPSIIDSTGYTTYN